MVRDAGRVRSGSRIPKTQDARKLAISRWFGSLAVGMAMTDT